MNFNVRITSADDLIYLNRIMSLMDGNFDVKTRRVEIDGKSLLGMLAIKEKEINIYTDLEGKELDLFKAKISDLCYEK